MLGGKILYKCLEESGVKQVYGVIGTTIVGLLDGFYKEEGVRYVSTRHEQVSISMADAAARVTGRPGVAFVHAGPGILNGAISVGNSYKDSSPTLVVAGNVRRRLRGRDGFVELDIKSVFSPITNGCFQAHRAEAIPTMFRKAYEATFANGGGPAILEVPEDVWMEDAEPRFEPIKLPDPKRPDPKQLESAIARFGKGERKALLLGQGAKTISRESILNFARKYSIPIITTGNGRGIVDESDPLCFGPCSFAAQSPPADKVLETADVLLCLGSTISDMTCYHYTTPMPENIIIVNISEKAVSVFPEDCLFVHCDAREFFNVFTENLGKMEPQDTAWLDSLSSARESWRQNLAALASIRKTPLSASYVLHNLYPMLPHDYIYSAGAGLHTVYAMQYLPVHEKSSFLMAHNFGAMGFAFPAALGAKLNAPNRTVLSITGDGDFMMTVQDLETAYREKIDVLIIVINDNAYRALTATQKILLGGRVVGSTHSNPDFAKLAESFNAKGYTMRKPEEVVPILEKALSENGVRLIDCQIDPDDPAPLNLEAVLRMKAF